MPDDSIGMLFKKLAQNIKSEYHKLLSVGVNDSEAEKMILDYFSDSSSLDTPQEGYMWLALALSQWELGRLSSSVKEKAFSWIASPRILFDPEMKSRLYSKLDAPMPEKKKIRRPSYIAHCPWPVGSLLAYRIISATHPMVSQSPFYGKYVLLRIIQIKRHPVSRLAPDALWNESMIVGLYNWIGNTIPDPEIADKLSFTAIAIREPLFGRSVSKFPPITTISDLNEDVIRQVTQSTTQSKIETCCDLSWRCAKGIRRDDVFTFLACDSRFVNKISPFFKTEVTEYSIINSIPFDFDLVKRFKQLANCPD